MPVFAVYNVKIDFSYVSLNNFYYLNVYRNEQGLRQLEDIYTDTNPDKSMTFVFAKILRSYYCSNGNGETSLYISHSTDYKGNLYLTVRDVSSTRTDITVTTTVKYLNFDS